MQNAAVAAVVAGAEKLLADESDLSDYSEAWLINFVPEYLHADYPENNGKAIFLLRVQSTCAGRKFFHKLAQRQRATTLLRRVFVAGKIKKLYTARIKGG